MGKSDDLVNINAHDIPVINFVDLIVYKTHATL
jgi:hypothetical protein